MTQDDKVAKLEAAVLLLKKQVLQLQFDLDDLKDKFEDWETTKRRKAIDEL